MAVGNELNIRWNFLQEGTPNIEFWYPYDTPSDVIRIYHGVSSNVPNRNIIKTIRSNESAGGVRNLRSIGYEDELIRLDIVLTTYEEAYDFSNFFNNIIKGTAKPFYFRNNFTGQESIVRSLNNTLSMGEAEGHPYSFSLLLKKETPVSWSTITLNYDIIYVPSVPTLFGGYGSWSGFMYPTASKTLHMSGSNSGQLGLGDYNSRIRFTQVGSETDWNTGSGGDSHSVIINDSNEIYSSGINTYGQLGLGDTTTRNTFTQIGSGTNWRIVSCGYNHTVALKTDGTLWAWGQNNFGQLGIGTFDSNPHSTPTQIGSDTDWEDVRCGSYFTIVKKSNGELWGCGWDDNGQLGQGSTSTRRTSLVKIGTDVNWDFFDAGWAHTVAVKNNGDLYAWGMNTRGELGDGTTVDKYTPTKIGSDVWTSIAAGAGGPGVTYGIKSNGILYAWGINENYELGIGTFDSSPHPNPIIINSDTDWEDVVAYGVHGIAVKGNNEIWGWGLNSQGEIGVGNTSPVTIPTKTFLVGNQTELKWDVNPSFPFP